MKEGPMKNRMKLLVLAIAAASALPIAAADSDLSRRYGYSTFRARTGAIDLLVDAYPASLAAGEPLVAIPVTIARVTAGKEIELTPDSFKLIDAEGNTLSVASYAEVLRDYDKLSFDRSLSRRGGSTLGSFYRGFHRVGGTFFPTHGRGTRVDRIEVPSFGVHEDILYFPMPPAGLAGVLTLEMTTPDNPPVQVKFVASPAQLAALPTRPAVETAQGS